MAEDQKFTLPPLEERPLVTFALFAYNQEKFIREAVEGALSQTYEPLEIILSDDCSTDRTFEIMVEMAAAYDGPHKLILNKNPLNFGINKHVFSVDLKSKGEIIIHAAGDDISLPERTNVITQAYLRNKIGASLIMSNAEIINDEGVTLGLYREPGLNDKKISRSPVDFSSLGSAGTYAICRKLIESFPTPDTEIYGEDKILLARANLLSGTIYLNDILVKYRVSRSGVWSSNFFPNLSTNQIITRQSKRSEDYLRILNQIEKDISEIKHTPNQDLIEQIVKLKNSHKNRVSVVKSNFLDSILSLINEIKTTNEKAEILKLFLIRWLPILRDLKNKTRPQNLNEHSHPAVGYPSNNNSK